MNRPSQSSPLRVLIADDEEVIADTLRLILNQHGFIASAVYDGAAAIALARDWRPNVFLCDVVMPGMNGIDAAIQIRGIVPECNVLLLSGQVDVRDKVVEAHAQGHQFDLLVKPVHPSDILEYLRTLANGD